MLFGVSDLTCQSFSYNTALYTILYCFSSLGIQVVLVIVIVPYFALLPFLLQPYKAGKLIKFTKSAALGEQVIFSSKEEHCNPLFAKS